MKVRRYWLGLLVGIPIMLALLLVGCGGGDDDDGGSGGSGDSSSSGSVATGSDEKYVADICKAAAQFFDEVQKVTNSASSAASEEDIMKQFQKPFENFANALEKAKPPKDLKDWHAEAVKQIKVFAEAIKKGDFEALANSDQVFPDPPQNVTDRLEKVAAKNEDCQRADVSFSNN